MKRSKLHTFKAGNAEPSTRVVHADVAEALLRALEALVERGTDSPQHLAAEAAIALAAGQDNDDN